MAVKVPVGMLRTIAWLWCIVVVGYIAYGWYAYAGLYRVLAEWQIATFGGYRVFLTALLPAIVLALPGLWVAGLLQRAAGTMPNAQPVDPRRGLLAIAAVGLVALVMAAGALVLGLHEAGRELTVATLDLRRTSALPAADRFIVTGVAHTDLMLSFESETRGARRNYAYVPLTAPDWQRGQPLVYFLRTNQTAYMPPGGGGTYRLATSQAPFVMTTQPAVIEAHALPGPVREIYRSNNVPLARELHIFSQTSLVALDHYWVTAAVGGLVGLACLLAAGITALRLRQGTA